MAEQLCLDFGREFARQTLKATTYKKNQLIGELEINEKMHGYAYCYFADAINRLVLGCSAKRFRQHHGLGVGENLRDYLKVHHPEKLMLLEEAERLMLKLIASRRKPQQIVQAIRQRIGVENVS